MSNSPSVKVRRRGRTRELHVGGTFASLYRPDRLLTGSVWDAMAAPALALEAVQAPKILLLGLGGGSVARLLRAIVPKATITGVDRDPRVIGAARRELGLDELDVEVVVADALTYLERDRRRYDMVIEDCFIELNGDLAKPEFLPTPGLELATKRLTRSGMLVSNSVNEATAVETIFVAQLHHVVRIELEDCYNKVFVGSRRTLDARRLRRAVARDSILSGALENLSFRTC